MQQVKYKVADNGSSSNYQPNILDIFSSMKLGLFLLLLLAVEAGAGTFLPGAQGWFYHSFPFLAVPAALALNLTACILKRIRPVIKAIFKAPFFPLYAFGSILLHAGMLLILLGAIAGGILSSAGTIFIPVGSTFLPGDVLKGGYGFQVYVDDFIPERYPDGSPSQYITRISVRDGSESGRYNISVNNPVTLGDTKFFQSSWGYGVTLSFSGSSEELTVAEGETLTIPGDHRSLTIIRYILPENTTFRAEGGSREQSVPRVAYAINQEGKTIKTGVVMFDQPVGLGNGKSIIFKEPILFTGLQLKRDPGLIMVWVGFALVLTGFVMTIFRKIERNKPEGCA